MSRPDDLRQFDWLADCAFNTFSQFGEDGVIQAIFSVIRPENRWCFECGAADGLLFSNTRRLIEDGWRAVLVESDKASFARLCGNCEGFGERVTCVQGAVGDDCRIETILHRCGAPIDIDLICIDVDGQDYYLFNSLLQYRPRVIVIEYDWQAEDDEFIPRLGDEGQAGIVALLRLAAGKSYTEVHRTRTNTILVRQPLDKLLSGSREQMLLGERAA